MNLIKQIGAWGDYHHPAVLVGVRALLGGFLFLKGFLFMQNTAYLNWILEQQDWLKLSHGILTIIIYYVIVVHMMGGLLILVGIFTRLMCLLQLPVLLCAIYILNLFKTTINSDMTLSLVTCILLIVFMLIGSGPVSLDRYLDEINK